MLTKKHLSLIALIVATLLFMLWLAGLLTWGKIRPGNQEVKKPGEAYRVLTVAEVDIPQELPVLATVISPTLTHLSAQAPGRVSRIYVEAGSRVNQGAPLISLSAPEFQAKTAQAQAQVAQAQAHLSQITADYQRYQRLLKEGAVSPREFEAMAARYKGAQAALAQARAQVQEADAFQAYTILKAPKQGVIAARPAAVGDLAQPGQPLVSLYDPAILQIEGEVNDDYRAFLKPGTLVRLEVPAAGWQGAATLSEIFPISAPASRTFKVRTALIEGRTGGPKVPHPPLKLPSHPPAMEGDTHADLVPGMFARMYLHLGMARGILIPQIAVRQVGQLAMVEVLTEGRPVLRQIKPGRQVGEQVEVLSGLTAGEQIISP